MVGPTAPITTRLDQADQEFLSSLHIGDATTPSEKLRALVAQERLRQDAKQDYSAALRMVRGQLDGVLNAIQVAEQRSGSHSQLVERVLLWLPEAVALVLAGSPDLEAPEVDEALNALESALAQRALRLVTATLETALSADGALYDPAALGQDKLRSILRLAQLLATHKGESL